MCGFIKQTSVIRMITGEGLRMENVTELGWMKTIPAAVWPFFKTADENQEGQTKW